MAILKFIHILIGLTMFGFIIACYFYFLLNKSNFEATQNVLRCSLMIDSVILVFIFILFMTGTKLVLNNHLSFIVPWVHMAYTLLGLVTFCWFVLVVVKIINFLRKHRQIFYGKRIFHTGNIVIIILMVMIIHDAVTKMTLLK